MGSNSLFGKFLSGKNRTQMFQSSFIHIREIASDTLKAFHQCLHRSNLVAHWAKQYFCPSFQNKILTIFHLWKVRMGILPILTNHSNLKNKLDF